ncbi:MAG: molecular chaperone HtpG [Candidatus Midichloria sp.]|nr:molecular chaperone HtpG [Candidatus Midichloria sp.]
MAVNTIKKDFTAEVDKVLKLVIHSIYTNKDIFLRELISNASDACDKLRYEALHNSSISSDQELKITVILDKKNGVLSIKDNGIGMNRDDLVNNLGTIANSGTQKFLEQNIANKQNLELIGQFGVGFYSAFMVADLVTVYSRKANTAQTFVWQSTGESGYTVVVAPKEKGLDNSGTVVELKLTPESLELLEKYRIQHIIKTYSDHIAFPIELIDEDGTATIVNSSAALWLKAAAAISKEQYEEFYHHISHMPDKPWLILHNKVEGNLTYTNLLFVPTNKPFDLFRPQAKSRVKLYIKRVFITDEGINLIPPYLRFLCGIIDSEDLPLNISRETLQNNLTVSKIRKSITKKVLTTLQKKIDEGREEYEKFWSNFGEVLKEGLCEGAFEEKELLLDICRFHTLRSKEKTISIADYLVNMVEGQEEIYYIIGNNIETLANHPQLQGFKERNIDVILLTDHVDDFWVSVVNQYKNYALKSVISSDIDLNKIQHINKEAEKAAENSINDQKIINYIKGALQDKIKDVRISTKLTDNPVCLVIPEGAMNIRMEKMLIEQKQLNKRSLKIMEINTRHNIFKKLSAYIDSDSNKALKLTKLLFNQACILEGEVIDNPYEFVNTLNSFLEAS